MQTKPLHKLTLAALEELKATEIVTIDVRKISSVTDLMVICTGRSSRHVKSIADNLLMRVKEQSVRPLSVQGVNQGEWVLVDVGVIIVHIMLPEVRAFYALEKLWTTPHQTRKSSSTLPKPAKTKLAKTKPVLKTKRVRREKLQ